MYSVKYSGGLCNSEASFKEKTDKTIAMQLQLLYLIFIFSF